MESSDRSIRFINSRGLTLAGNLLLPPGTGLFPAVVFAHGFGSGKDSPRSVPIARDLVDNGVAAFLFDFTGHGESGGSRSESTINRQVGDLLSAIGYLLARREIDKGRIALHGSSSGCLVSLFVALSGGIAGLALRAPRTDGYYPELYDGADEITAPTLIIQGELDPLLPETKRFYDKLTCTKKLKILPGADHLFTDPERYAIAERLTVGWLVQLLTGGQARAA